MLYEIINASVKPLQTDRYGNDIRPMRDRVGFSIGIVTGKPPHEVHNLVHPGASLRVSEMTEGIMKLARKGYITVSQVTDIGEELKKFAAQPVESAPIPAKEIPADVRATSSMMGEEPTHFMAQKTVNPDGEPPSHVQANARVIQEKKVGGVVPAAKKPAQASPQRTTEGEI